jgi:hypothetical protein
VIDGKRRRKPIHDPDFPILHYDGNPSVLLAYAFSAICCSAIVNEPLSYEEATICIDKDKWKDAMDSEMKSLVLNNTWTLTEHCQLVVNGSIKKNLKVMVL